MESSVIPKDSAEVWDIMFALLLRSSKMFFVDVLWADAQPIVFLESLKNLSVKY